MEEETPQREESAATAAAGTSSQLSPREVELENRLRVDPFDTDAWEELSRSVSGKKDPKRMRLVTERMLERFPLAGAQWVRYAEMEEEIDCQDNVKTVLRRVLATSNSVEVWVYYLSWLRRTKLQADLSPLEIQTARAELKEAFEEAIKQDKVGAAMDAGPIWRMYLDFLDEEPETTPYEQGQKMDAQRKLYRQAVAMPIRGLEALWKEYQAYENGKHERTAKQLLDEIQPAHNHAAEVLKERETFWRPLLQSSSSKKTLPQRPSSSNNMNNAEAWMKMLAYEKANPEQLSPVDFKVRVRLAFGRALTELWFHSDVWYAFFDFERSVKDDAASLTILRESLKALPDSALLHFCLADALEMDGLVDDARSVHEGLLARSPSNVAFIQRMRFARRVDGIAAQRNVFRRARAWDGCDASMYCAAAELEFTLNKSSSVARKAYDLGLKRFPKSILLAHRYIDLMCAINDDEAARDVFERLIDSFHSNNALQEDVFSIWERYREFVRDHGRDLQLVADIERRMQAQFRSNQDLNGLFGVVHRYVLHGTAPSMDYLNVDVDMMLSSSSSGGRMLIRPQQQQQQPRRPGQVISTTTTSTTAPTKQEPEPEDASIPPFLRKLVAILPKKLHITQMDVDFVMRNLIKGTLPPPPTSSSVTRGVGGIAEDDGENGDTGSLVVRKRRSDQMLGAEGAPLDAFKQRQKRSRG